MHANLFPAWLHRLQTRAQESSNAHLVPSPQGKRRGDPGADPKTVEPVTELRHRLWDFWDTRFPPTGPSVPTGPTDDALRMLYVSHGAAVREFILSLVEMADRKLRPYELALPDEEAAMIWSGSKRIDNCSRTDILMEWVEDGTGECISSGMIFEVSVISDEIENPQIKAIGRESCAFTPTTRTLSTRAVLRARQPTQTWSSRLSTALDSQRCMSQLSVSCPRRVRSSPSAVLRTGAPRPGPSEAPRRTRTSFG